MYEKDMGTWVNRDTDDYTVDSLQDAMSADTE